MLRLRDNRSSGAKRSSPSVKQLPAADRPAARGELPRELADGAVDDGAAVARARRRLDGVERRAAAGSRGRRSCRDRAASPRSPSPTAATAALRPAARRAAVSAALTAARRSSARASASNALPRASTVSQRALPASAAMRCTKREVTVGAPPICRRGQHDFRRAERLGEVVRGKADAALRRIEAEVAAHRPGEPGIAARLRRPGRFVEAAEHDAVDRSAGALRADRRCARARRGFPAGARRGRRSAALKQLDVIARAGREARRPTGLGDDVRRKRAASASPSCRRRQSTSPSASGRDWR